MTKQIHDSWKKWTTFRELDIDFKYVLNNTLNIKNTTLFPGEKQKIPLFHLCESIKAKINETKSLSLLISDISTNILDTSCNIVYEKKHIDACNIIINFYKTRKYNKNLSNEIKNLYILYLCFIYSHIPESIIVKPPFFDFSEVTPATPIVFPKINKLMEKYNFF